MKIFSIIPGVEIGRFIKKLDFADEVEMAYVNLTVDLIGIDEVLEKTERLAKLLKEAKTLADELAPVIDKLDIDIKR